MNESLITLKGLLSVIESSKPITINLYNSEDNLLLITFLHPGYAALEDVIEMDEITKIVINGLYTLDVYIDTSNN